MAWRLSWKPWRRWKMRLHLTAGNMHRLASSPLQIASSSFSIRFLLHPRALSPAGTTPLYSINYYNKIPSAAAVIMYSSYDFLHLLSLSCMTCLFHLFSCFFSLSSLLSSLSFHKFPTLVCSSFGFNNFCLYIRYSTSFRNLSSDARNLLPWLLIVGDALPPMAYNSQ